MGFLDGSEPIQVKNKLKVLIFSRVSFACVKGKASSRNWWKPKKAVESGIVFSLKEIVWYCNPFERFWKISLGNFILTSFSEVTCLELSVSVLYAKTPVSIKATETIKRIIFYIDIYC